MTMKVFLRMHSFTQWIYRIVTIGIFGVASSYAADFSPYAKELDHFKNISREIHQQKEISTSLKNVHNQLVASINECLDYLLWTLDNPTAYETYIAGIVTNINEKAKELQEQFQQEQKSLTISLGTSQASFLISLRTQAVQASYQFLKELKNNSEKDKIKQQLIDCKWHAIS